MRASRSSSLLDFLLQPTSARPEPSLLTSEYGDKDLPVSTNQFTRTQASFNSTFTSRCSQSSRARTVFLPSSFCSLSLSSAPSPLNAHSLQKKPSLLLLPLTLHQLPTMSFSSSLLRPVARMTLCRASPRMAIPSLSLFASARSFGAAKRSICEHILLLVCLIGNGRQEM